METLQTTTPSAMPAPMDSKSATAMPVIVPVSASATNGSGKRPGAPGAAPKAVKGAIPVAVVPVQAPASVIVAARPITSGSTAIATAQALATAAAQEEEAHLGKNKRPDLIGTRPCERYLNGHCNFGKDCWFVHEGEARAGVVVPVPGVKSTIPLPPQPPANSEPPKPKISLAVTNPWGKVKPQPETGASSPQRDHSPLQSSSNTAAPQPMSHSVPTQLARPIPLPVTNPRGIL